METGRNCRRYAVQLRLLKLLGRGFSFSVSKFVYIFYANSSWQIIVVRINSQCIECVAHRIWGWFIDRHLQ